MSSIRLLALSLAHACSHHVNFGLIYDFQLFARYLSREKRIDVDTVEFLHFLLVSCKLISVSD